MPSATFESRAQVLYGPKDLRLISKPVVAPLADEVQIAIHSTTLCGSDVHYYTHFANGDIEIKEPLSQGHESAGEVLALGANVQKHGILKIGDRVALEVGIPCEDYDTCESCKTSRYNLCEQMRFRSSAASFPHFQGTLQDRVNHPAKWCHKLPPSISYDEGALLEPLSVAVQAVRKASIGPKNSCLIIGAGAIGLLVAAVLRNEGCHNITIADIAENRLKFALENNYASATFLIVPERGPTRVNERLAIAKKVAASLQNTKVEAGMPHGKFHVTFECTGVEGSVQTAIYSTRAGGKVLLVGMGSPVQSLPMSIVGNREVDLLGVWRYANTYPRALQIMEASKIGNSSIPNIRKLITHTFQGLETVPDAFNLAARTSDSNGNLVIKVVVNN